MNKRIDVKKLRAGDVVLNRPPGLKRMTRWRVVCLVTWAGGRRARITLRLLSHRVEGAVVEVRHPRRARWSRDTRTMQIALRELAEPWWSLLT